MLKVMSEHLVRDRKVTGAFSCGSLGLVTGYRNRLVFFIMLSGCFENCLPSQLRHLSPLIQLAGGRANENGM